jgi:hypothetical protein
MAFGGRFKGTHGVFQIDGAYQNFVLVEQGVLPDAASPGNGVHTLNSSKLTNTAIIAFSGPTAVCVITYGTGAVTISKNAGLVRYFIFDRIAASTGAGWGMRIKHPTTAEILYDNRYPPMRSLGNASMSGASVFMLDDGNGASLRIGGDNKEVAVVHCARLKREVSPGQGNIGTTPNTVRLGYTKTASTGDATVVARTFTIFPGGPNSNVQNDGFYLIVDVTGY